MKIEEQLGELRNKLGGLAYRLKHGKKYIELHEDVRTVEQWAESLTNLVLAQQERIAQLEARLAQLDSGEWRPWLDGDG